MNLETVLFGISWVVFMNALAFSLGMLTEWNRKVGIFLTTITFFMAVIILILIMAYLASPDIEMPELTIGFMLYMFLNGMGGSMTTPSWLGGRLFFQSKAGK